MESAIGPGARAGTGAGKPQPGHLGGGAQAGRLFTGGRQIRPTLPRPESARPHNGGGNSGLTTHSELTSGKDGFPTATARRLDGCGPFRSIHSRDGWLRRENQNTPALRSTAAHLLAIHRPFFAVNGLPQGGTPPHGPQLPVSRPAGSLQFNLRGRLPSCSRKWMSGPATPWTQPLTGRQKQIVTATSTANRALQEPSVKCREKCFFLDKPLSWMSVAGEDRSPATWAPLFGAPDLPCFVSRPAPGALTKWQISGLVRMETPELYFIRSVR